MRARICSTDWFLRDSFGTLKFGINWIQVLALNATVGVREAARKSLRTRVTMPQKLTNNKTEAENGCATRRTQRRHRNKTEARSSAKAAHATKNGLHVGLR